MFAYALNARMARKMDYLQEEVRVLKEALAAATGKTRIELNAEQRRRLALKGKELTAEERRASARSCARKRSSPGFASWPHGCSRPHGSGGNGRESGRRVGAAPVSVPVTPPWPSCGSSPA